MYVSIYVYIFIYVFIYISNVHTSKLKARQRPPTIKVRSDLKASSWVMFTCKYFFFVMITSDWIYIYIYIYIHRICMAGRYPMHLRHPIKVVQLCVLSYIPSYNAYQKLYVQLQASSVVICLYTHHLHMMYVYHEYAYTSCVCMCMCMYIHVHMYIYG